jgi:hypothetical protein
MPLDKERSAVNGVSDNGCGLLRSGSYKAQARGHRKRLDTKKAAFHSSLPLMA